MTFGRDDKSLFSGAVLLAFWRISKELKITVFSPVLIRTQSEMSILAAHTLHRLFRATLVAPHCVAFFALRFRSVARESRYTP